MPRTTIVLADDHEVVRQGLCALLEAEPGFKIVGTAADGLDVADLVAELRPDVLVVDLMMPGLSGLDVTRQVTKRCPSTRVIILSMYSNEPFLLEALRNGASGYVLKGASAAELIRAIREVSAGRRYLSPPFTENAIESYVRKAKTAAADPYDSLTVREREVLHLAAEGLTSAEIAVRLGISPRTAESHRARILHKLGLNGQTELVRYALRRGVVPLEDDRGTPRGRDTR
jgi:DNA-binding NarL/FixJ family response regulator